MDSADKTCVAIRVRPLNDRENGTGQGRAFKCMPNNAIAQVNRDEIIDNQLYNYDKVFNEAEDTAAVYTYVASDIVAGVTLGINGTIFAYGQTSSGKTHTMIGSNGSPGIIGIAAQDIFRLISEQQDRNFLLRVSFVEIYNENIRDLLADDANTFVAIREDPRKGVFCDAVEKGITDLDSIAHYLKKGFSRRTVESTNMNEASSRSHTIFKLVVESKAKPQEDVEVDEAVLVASLNLVDLAGSESVRHSGTTGQRAKEGGKINQSLLSLSRVIHALSSTKTHVPYRDSKLTQLLQPSLSGHAKLCVICCITPSERYIEETRSTLQFASRAKLVTTNATVNEVLDEAALLRRLQRELYELKSKPQQQQQMYSSDTSGEQRMSDVDVAVIEAERDELLSRVEALQTDQAARETEVVRLKGLVFCAQNKENLEMNNNTQQQHKRQKLRRETWHPAMPSDHTSSSPAGTGNMSTCPMADTIDHGEFLSFLRDSVKDAEILEWSKRLKQEQEANAESEALFQEEINILRDQLKAAELAATTTAAMSITSSVATQQHQQVDQDDDIESDLHAEVRALLSLFTELESSRDSLVNVSSSSPTHEALLQYEEHQLQVSTLSAQLEMASETYQRALSTAEEKYEVLSAKNIELASQVLSLTEELEAVMEMEVEASTALVGKDDELAALQLAKDDELAALQLAKDDELAALQLAKDEECAVLQTQVARLEQELAETLTASTTSTITIATAATNTELYDVVASEEHESHILELTATISQLEQQVVALTTAFEVERAVSSLRETVMETHFSQTVEEITSQLQDQQQQQQEQEQQAAMIDMESLSALSHVVANKDAELLTMQCALEEAREHIIQLETDMAAYEETFDATVMAAVSDEYAQDVEELVQKNISLEQQVYVLTGQVEVATEAYEHVKLLTSALQTATCEKNEMEIRLAALTEESSMASEQYTTDKSVLESQIAQLSTELQQITTSLQETSASSENVAELMEELSVLQEQLQLMSSYEGELTVRLAERETELTELHSQICELTVNLKGTTAKSANFEHTIESLSMQLQQTSEEKEAIQSKLSAVSTTLEATETENASLRTELIKVQEEYAVLEQQQQKQQQLNQGASVIVGLVDALPSMKDASSLASATTHDAKVYELSNTVAAMEHQSSSLEVQIHDLKALNAQLTKDRDACDTLIESLRRDLSQSAEIKLQSLNAKQDEINKLTSALEEVKERTIIAEKFMSATLSREGSVQDGEEFLRKRMGQLQFALDIAKSEQHTAENKLASLEKENKLMQNKFVCAEEKYEAELQGWVGKAETLRHQLAAASNAVDSVRVLEKRVGEVTSERDCAIGAADAAYEQLNVLEKQLEESQSTIVSLRALTDSSASADMKRDLDFALVRESELINQLSDAQRDALESTRRQKKLKEEVAMMHEEWARSSEAIQQLTSQNADLLVQLSTMTAPAKNPFDEEEIARLESKVSSLKSALAASEEKQAQTTEELSRLHSEMGSLESQVTEAQDVIAAYEQKEGEMAELHTILATSESLVEEYKTRVCDLQLVVDTLHQTMAVLQETFSNHVETIRSLQDQLTELESAHTAATTATTTTDVTGSGEEEREMLLAELNALMEQKMQAEARVVDAELQVKAVRQQLSEYDKISAREQAVFFQAAEKEMQALREKLEQTDEEAKKKIADLLLDVEEKAELEALLDDKEQALAIAEHELTSLRNAKVTAAANSKSASAAEVELKKYKVEMEKVLAQKEERIVHLEACKLTQDQVEKIKVVKEERKKYQEECKVMKRQLIELKKLYDELKAAKSTSTADGAVMTSGAGSRVSTRSSAAATTSSQQHHHSAIGELDEVNELQARIEATEKQLEDARNISKALRDKLRECSHQLQEYEKERSAVVDVLAKNGIDTKGLLSVDTSLSEDASMALEQDLADCVNKLAQKVAVIGSSQQGKGRGNPRGGRGGDEELTKQAKELEELQLEYSALEKRIDTMSDAARVSREERKELLSELSTLKEQLTEVRREVDTLRKKLQSKQTEIQTLEEENVELMKENKELRKGSALSAQSGAGSGRAVQSSQTPISEKKKGKSSQGSENDPGVLNSAPRSSKRQSSTDIIKTSTAGTGTCSQLSQVSEDAGGGGGDRKRTRVSSRVTKQTVGTDAASAEQAGECAQS